MIRALITCETTDSFLNALKERGIGFEHAGWGLNGSVLTDNEILQKSMDCQLIITEIEQLRSRILRQLPNLKFIGVSRGTPINVDIDYCRSQGIIVVHTPGRNADSVADYCIGMMIDASRRLSDSSRHLAQNGWMVKDKLPYLEFRGRELGKSVVGLYGYGHVGKKVAQRLHKGFGSKVIFFDPYVDADKNALKVSSLQELFKISDIVSLHAPVVEETRNSVNELVIGNLGISGILINSARADLIEEEDLYRVLEAGEIGGAVLDVFWNEPIGIESKWLKLPNVICTPHIAGASKDVVANHCDTILIGIDDWLQSQQKRRDQDDE